MIRNRFTQDVAAVSDALNSGQIAIVPTDTVYGLAASLDHREAIKRIYDAKGRPDDKPIPILIDRYESLDSLVSDSCDVAERLMRVFWPGALTIVFPASDRVPDECLSGDGTVGIRMPDHADLRQLLGACGGALAVTSANRSGQPENSSPTRAYATLRDYVGIVFDCGVLPNGPPSTVVDPWSDPPRIFRQGAIDRDRIISAAAGR